MTITNQNDIQLLLEEYQRLDKVMLNLIADMAVLKYEIDLLNGEGDNEY